MTETAFTRCINDVYSLARGMYASDCFVSVIAYRSPSELALGLRKGHYVLQASCMSIISRCLSLREVSIST